MYCKKCGKEINDDSKFCMYCGTQLGSSVSQFFQVENIKNTLAPPPIQNQQNTYTQYTGSQQEYSQQTNWQTNSYQQTQTLPMKWFQFIIWIQLFLSALVNAVTGFLHVTGLRYGSSRSYVYDWTPGLIFLDILFGVAYLGYAVVLIFVRQQLAHYKKNSPMMLIGACFVQIPFVLVYAILPIPDCI